MHRRLPRLVTLLSSCLLGAFCLATLSMASPTNQATRQQGEQLKQAGNYLEALTIFTTLIESGNGTNTELAHDLDSAVECLGKLVRISEIDDLLERSVTRHPSNWRLLASAANSYENAPHHGFLISGQFKRGWARGGNVEPVSSIEQDRTRALQLLLEALHLSKQSATREEQGALYIEFARALSSVNSFRLTTLTDLKKIPPYEHNGMSSAGWQLAEYAAPTHEDGSPIFHSIPASFESATTDGERWRWALSEASKLSAQGSEDALWELAQFAHREFGVETLRANRPAGDATDYTKTTSSILQLHTLADNETTARLASGVRRFELPNDFDFLAHYKTIAHSKSSSRRVEAYQILGSAYENRRQFPKAASVWREAFQQVGSQAGLKESLDRIVGAWGTFEPTRALPAGTQERLTFRSRNATRVQLTAHSIDVKRALVDLQRYLESKPAQLDQQKLQLEEIGHQLVTENKDTYLGPEVARWSVDLQPAENHFDSASDIEVPFTKAGAYLVTARIPGGNEVSIVVWIANTALFERRLDKGNFYFVGDAVTGKPVRAAKLSFIGYRTLYRHKSSGYTVDTKSFSRTADEDGTVLLSAEDIDHEYQWLTVVEAENSRLAFSGFHGIWFSGAPNVPLSQAKLYGITDRPVYRPGNEVKYSLWLRTAHYELTGNEPLANTVHKLTIRNPRGDVIKEDSVAFDSKGTAQSSLVIDPTAPLGMYSMGLEGIWPNVTFRVEEYKKPEFEVSVLSPNKPIALGDIFNVQVNAKYLFGAPVTNATVSYKVMKHDYSASIYPRRPWDWLYGNGYWWWTPTYTWYPNWSRWGCSGPVASWLSSGSSSPPELVQAGVAAISTDGRLSFPIDTRLAKELYGNSDHRYEITVEVTDASRRTVTGSGSVIAARDPFKVFVWLHAGFIQSGDTVTANLTARTIDDKPVMGEGQVTLFSVTSDQHGTPIERSILTESVSLNEDGQGMFSFKAPVAGQYRLSYRLSDKERHTIEGAQVFSVRDPSSSSGTSGRFNEIEVFLDKSEYTPGDTAKVRINTYQEDSTVVLFVQSTSPEQKKPQLVSVSNRTATIEIPILPGDMPNFFIDAVTIRDARVHSVTREVIVPPTKRVMNVSVVPEKHEVAPGDPVKIRVLLTDLNGTPVAGRVVVTAYDRALEYVSGGSNIPEIREFFWKWRRSHSDPSSVTLDRISYPLVPPGEGSLTPIGSFGDYLSLQRRGATRDRMTAGAPDDRSFTSTALLAEAAKSEGSGGDLPTEAAAAQATSVRSLFADTALWSGNIDVDSSGVGHLEFVAPDNLTTWVIRAWGLADGTQVGEGTAETITTKDLLVRLQTPRFLVEKDEVVVSANVHNYTASTASVTSKIEVTADQLSSTSREALAVDIPSRGEHRFDFTLRALTEGLASIRTFALSERASDAMELPIPVKVYGMLKTDSFSGYLSGATSHGALAFSIPEDRRPEQSKIVIRFSPSLAAAMIDALPYLHDYPYGCTEQTLNRFLPTVVTLKTLSSLGLDLAAIRHHLSKLNPQDLSLGGTSTTLRKPHEAAPVFDESHIASLAKNGVERLSSMQLSDGGWGWFSGYGEQSSGYLSAYVLRGLMRAAEAGIPVPASTKTRGFDFLQNHEAAQLTALRNASSKTNPFKEKADNLDAFIHLVLTEAGLGSTAMRDLLIRDRLELSVYGRILVGLSLAAAGDRTRAMESLRGIEQYLREDQENQTAYLDLGGAPTWWYWYGDETETQAYYVKLLVALDPENTTAQKVVKYLLNNRSNGTHWKSTRDTAAVIEAFTEYLEKTGEAVASQDLTVSVDGKRLRQVTITPNNLFSIDNTIVLSGKDVVSGQHTVEFEKRGNAPLYFNAYVTNFSLEDEIKPSGLEIKIMRRFFRLEEERDATDVARTSSGTARVQTTARYKRIPLGKEDSVTPGELVEVELEIDSKNDYEYLVFEDMKAAGLEPLEVRSGYNDNALGAYVEYRDDRTAFFVRNLPRGKRSVSYRLRAEIPGNFSALPSMGYAMYAPDLQGNSSAYRIHIVDTK